MPPTAALPSVGVPWARSEPVMSPAVRGTKLSEKLQLPFAASVVQGVPERTNSRGRTRFRASGLAVRLFTVNCRVPPTVSVGNGPKFKVAGTICRPAVPAV